MSTEESVTKNLESIEKSRESLYFKESRVLIMEKDCGNDRIALRGCIF